MKTIPFLALFAMLILSSSYISAIITQPGIEKAAEDHFQQLRVHQQDNIAAWSPAVATPDVSHFAIARSFDKEEFFKPINPVNGTYTKVLNGNDAFKSGEVVAHGVVAIKGSGTSLPAAHQIIPMVQRK